MLTACIFQEPVRFGTNIDLTTYTDGKRETLNPAGRAYPGIVWDHYQVSVQYEDWGIGADVVYYADVKELWSLESVVFCLYSVYFVYSKVVRYACWTLRHTQILCGTCWAPCRTCLAAWWALIFTLRHPVLKALLLILMTLKGLLCR